MDAQPQSSTVRSGVPLWYGLWTGIRPTQFVTGRIESEDRCFAFSYDRDGRNRLYEIRREGFDMFGGEKRKVFSMYDTGSFGTIERVTNTFYLKTVQGGELELANLKEEVDLNLSMRPDNSPCFVEHYASKVGCDCQPQPCHRPSQPSQARIVFGGIDKKCDPSTGVPLKSTHHWQARLKMTGSATVQSLAYRFDVDKNPVHCQVVGGKCESISCCDPDEYGYHIAPAGVNDEVPNIPVPSDVTPVFQGVQSYTARCPDGTFGDSVTITASATSNISQADADMKAKQEAVRLAQAQLLCRSCSPTTLLEFTVSNSSYNLTDVFAGPYNDSVGNPWRLIDQETLALYATGVVGEDGELSISFAQTDGDTTFDPVTHTLTDSSGTVVPVSVQVACPGGSEGTTWPEMEPYIAS